MFLSHLQTNECLLFFLKKAHAFLPPRYLCPVSFYEPETVETVAVDFYPTIYVGK